MHNVLIVIPAIKKNAVIPDQLIKKLNGVTLIQRAINTAKELTDTVLIVTDSEEISLIAKRNAIAFYRDSALTLHSDNIIPRIREIIGNRPEQHVILYRANTPLLESEILRDAYKTFLNKTQCILTSVKRLEKKLLRFEDNNLIRVENDYYKELKAFYIFDNTIMSEKFLPYVIEEEKSIEIEGYQDWWICEKILQRKRIVFNVIGSVEIGMGHIYHSLALAHEIMDHEVIFVCDAKYEIVVEKIASMDYKVIATENVLQTILDLKPDMVINDVLNTDAEYVRTLKERSIAVVNFEDLGEGARYADLVINELYDEPQIEGDHFLWGHKYLALRDEFENAEPNHFKEKVDALLITFGGTDQHNLTLLTLKSIMDIVRKNGIKIYIVCGGGYLHKEALNQYIDSVSYKNIEVHFALETVSNIMEKVQIAFSSNGRTVYELADMNIPAVIISSHKRESTHSFATLENGFIHIGIFDKEQTARLIKINSLKLIEDHDYRKLLFLNISKYSFRDNKRELVQKILELL